MVFAYKYTEFMTQTKTQVEQQFDQIGQNYTIWRNNLPAIGSRLFITKQSASYEIAKKRTKNYHFFMYTKFLMAWSTNDSVLCERWPNCVHIRFTLYTTLSLFSWSTKSNCSDFLFAFYKIDVVKLNRYNCTHCTRLSRRIFKADEVVYVAHLLACLSVCLFALLREHIFTLPACVSLSPSRSACAVCIKFSLLNNEHIDWDTDL